MTGIEKLTRFLLLSSLLPTGARSGNTVFVYSTLGGEALLPCANLLTTNCSAIDWTYFKGGLVQFRVEVRGGQVAADSDKARRLSVTPNCSLIIRDLVVEDAASYGCKLSEQEKTVTDVYLSVLSISSPSLITEMHPGGNLAVSCVLFTYYDAGGCKSYSAGVFTVRWVREDGTEIPNHGRYSLIKNTSCNITLITVLQKEDNDRRWSCQINTTKSSKAAFLDIKTSFLFQNSPTTTQTLTSPAVIQESQLPVSRIVLCVALPLMVCIVGFYMRKVDRKRAKRVSTAAFQLS